MKDYTNLAYLFLDACPIDFWGNYSRTRVEEVLDGMVENGIDSIGVLLPWGEFQPFLSCDRLDPLSLQHLQHLLDAAHKRNLSVFLRLLYAWDLRQEIEIFSVDRNINLMCDSDIQAAFEIFLGMIKQVIDASPCEVFPFVSWEDFLRVMLIPAGTASYRKQQTARLGFRVWLKHKYDLTELSELAERNIADYQEYIIPSNKEPDYRVFLEFFDFLFINRVFSPAKKVFGECSVEIRVDADQVHTRNGLEWFVHDAMYAINARPFFMTYWNPCMFQNNQGQSVSADTALDSLQKMLGHIEAKTGGAKHIVNQFNFIDNSKGYQHNASISPEQVSLFLEKSAPIMRKRTSGAGLWVYKDYLLNELYNGSFHLGDRGWTAEGVDFVSDGRGSVAAMRTDSRLAQRLYPPRAGRMGNKSRLRFEFAPGSMGEIEVTLSGHGLKRVRHRLEEDLGYWEFEVLTPRFDNNLYLNIRCIEGEVSLASVILFYHVQQSGFYEQGGSTGPYHDMLKVFTGKN